MINGLLLNIGIFIVSLAVLLKGADYFTDSTANMARQLGVSNIIIGMTLAAFATSLPELTTSLFAAKKGYSDMAIGNLVGSNLFNISAILGLSSIIAPIEITKRVVFVDIPFMLLFAIALVALMHGRRAVSKFYGFTFLAIYAIFIFLQTIKI